MRTHLPRTAWRRDGRDRGMHYVQGMIIVRFLRRWGVLALGVALLATGLTIFLSHTVILYEWTAYDPLSARAFLPGAPSSHSWDIAGQEANIRRASFRGQVAITVGFTMVAGWIGFRLGRRAKKARVAPDDSLVEQLAAG